LFSDELTGEFGKGLENASVDDFGLLGPFCGKLVALHFRSFATLSGAKQTSCRNAATSVFDPGCV